MRDLRTYGKTPFTVAVIHGGPGAAGEMEPVARTLAAGWNVLEPMQTAKSFDGQVNEVYSVMVDHAELPVILIGFSWGAWLSHVVAARYPATVKKLIMVGSGPFEEKYVAKLQETRGSRLTVEERTEYESITRTLGEHRTTDSDTLLMRLGTLSSKTDAYDPITDGLNGINAFRVTGDIFQSVGNAAAEMRRNGELLELGKLIRCPVVAIHGDYDPHPAEGVRKPLSTVIKDFRFILLKNCGHRPWIERQARDAFYELLRDELAC